VHCITAGVLVVSVGVLVGGIGLLSVGVGVLVGIGVVEWVSAYW
jgi:hypothetical protein